MATLARPYKILVTGSRHHTNADFIESVLEELASAHEVVAIIHGVARGADSIAARWGERMGHHVIGVPALWHRQGKSAGHRRNLIMLALEPDVVAAFPLPGSVGTLHMIHAAHEAGIPVVLNGVAHVAEGTGSEAG